MEQIKLIVSGYDHYEGVDVNPSMEIPRALAQEAATLSQVPSGDPLEGVSLEIHAVALPISFAKAWPVLKGAIDEVQPDIVISTGLKRSARGIAMERCAVNWKDAKADSDSDSSQASPQREPIDPDGPAAYWTRLPLRAILQDFARDNIAATLSSDAGTYVCNAVFYSLLDWATAHPGVLAGFVSLPQVSERAQGSLEHLGLSLDQQIQAGRDVVRQAAAYYRSPSSRAMLIA